jgi:hypothetical protein
VDRAEIGLAITPQRGIGPSLNWTALMNTAPDQSNDADFYVADDGTIGIGGLG